MAAQIKFHREAEPSEGLRSRKKIKTRVAIEEAALDLVAEQGFDATTVEQIAERAEVSTTTFFRYFPNKADAMLAHEGSRVPMLQQALQERPQEENDLEAISAAILTVWVPEIDAERSKRSCQAFANSPVLRGLHDDINRQWIRAIAEALSKRRGIEDDGRFKAAARIALGAFSDSVHAWIGGCCKENLADIIKRDFDIVQQLCCAWSSQNAAVDKLKR
jgi:AcrR family transcriptional regulator